jgi:hypothetical protein
MASCPVCETPRAPGALECPTCGHVFSEAAVNASVTPLPDFEPTLLSVGEVRSEVDPDLEPTAIASVGAVTLEAFPDLEATAMPPVEAADELMPDLERTAQVDEDLPTESSEVIRCRYCGNEGQTEGGFCDRCGMRLPRGATVAAAEAGSLYPGRVCRSCGSRDFSPTGRCMDCGVQLPASR